MPEAKAPETKAAVLDDVVGIIRETSPLASVQRLHSPRPILNRDQIVTAQVQGFTVVVKIAEFFVRGVNLDPADPHYAQGVLCVFFEPDALLDPAQDLFRFLDSPQGRRVKTKRMFGVYSQGVCCPVTVVALYGMDPTTLAEGQDLTAALRVTKYIDPAEASQYVASPTEHAPFPPHVPKTDEPNLQSHPEFLQQLVGRRVTVTLKMDGASMTVTSDGQLCGRNYTWDVRSTSNASYFAADARYAIRSTLQQHPEKVAVQGELLAPKINKNQAGVKDVTWLVFNVFRDGQYLPHRDVEDLCRRWGFFTVRCLHLDVAATDLPYRTLEDWLDYADTLTYDNQRSAEGIVVKTSDGLEPRLSFKVLSRRYLI